MKEILIPLNFTTTPTVYDTKQSFSTSDEASGVLIFTTTADVAGTVAILTIRNASENANRQTVLIERLDVNSSPFRYTLKTPLPFGQYEGTVLLKKNLTVIASATFLFGVNSSLSAEVLPDLVRAYSLDELVENVETEVSNLKDAVTLTVSETVKGVNKTESSLQAQENVRYLNEHTRKANELERISNEQARVAAELTRKETFDTLVDSEVIEQTVAQEVASEFQQIESTYANRLLSTEQQLADKAEKTDLEVEKARIDAFTTLVAGSTTGDAELIDGRVGSDGTTYANIGAAIRGQASKLNTELTDFKADVSLFLEPENLLNTADSDYKAGFFIAPTTGNLSSNAIYDTTGHINVTQGLRVSLTASDTGNVRFKQNMRFIAAYDAAGNIMSGSGSGVETTYYVVPIGVATIRASFINRTDWTNRAIFEVALDDETTKPYVEYFDPHYKAVVITDKTLAIENESADAKAVGEALAEINGNIIAYKNPSGVAKEASLGANVAISIPTFPEMLKTGQSFSYSAKFASFSAGDIISVGFMNPSYGTYQSWMEISVDRVKWMLSGTSAILNNLHGLTISDYLNVSVEVSPTTAQIKFTITTVGGSYSFTQISDSTRLNAIGTLTAKATMATADIILSGTCKQFKYHTWLLGDSYFGNGLDRLGGRFIEWGYAGGVLFDGLGGLNSQKGYAELQKLLTYGTPKTLVWYLGMNDNATTVATYFPLVEQLCDQLGIELIFNKIPFVPSRLVENAAVNNYVLASGRRYVDSYAAVGADGSGNWYTGHLSVDGVHPSTLGAAALTSRLIADVPEILSASN